MRHARLLLRICAGSITLALPLGLLGACGQKGPLYLPPRNGTVVTRPAGSNTPQNQPTPSPQTPTPDNPDKKDNDDTSTRPK